MAELLNYLRAVGLAMGTRYAPLAYTDPETQEDHVSVLHVGYTTDEAKACEARELGATVTSCGGATPKSKQLARGERRYRRKVASPKQWQAIMAAKMGPCRVCEADGVPWHPDYGVAYHHLVSRQDGGDDVARNIVPVCFGHHDAITRRVPLAHAEAKFLAIRRAEQKGCNVTKVVKRLRAYPFTHLETWAWPR
jgi:hypothetical protein